MRSQFSTLAAWGILALSLFTSCGGLTTKDHPPLVFALNLSSEPASLSLVAGSTVLASFPSLAPLESRPLTKIDESPSAVLLVGTSDRPAVDWTDPSGTPYSLRFQAGHLYAIVVDLHGQAAIYDLPETYSSDPKVCIVNVTPQTLSQVQVAPDWGKNVKIYAQDVVSIVPSEFYSLEPKTLGLYWQSQAERDEGAHTVARTGNGSPLRPSLQTGRYYLFLAGEGSIRDLTPTVE